MEVVLIGDVAGQAAALNRLLRKIPQCLTVLLGDIVDRGPNSRKVVQTARNNAHVITLKGNHEDMMVDFVEGGSRYDSYIWPMNGGGATIKSYLPEVATKDMSRSLITDAMHGDVKWMKELPLSYRVTGSNHPEILHASHAPWIWEEGEHIREFDRLWHRRPPKEQDGIFQVHGHNSRKNVLWYRDQPDAPPWGANIDTSDAKKLTALHWPSLKTFESEYEE